MTDLIGGAIKKSVKNVDNSFFLKIKSYANTKNGLYHK